MFAFIFLLFDKSDIRMDIIKINEVKRPTDISPDDAKKCDNPKYVLDNEATKKTGNITKGLPKNSTEEAIIA